MESLSQFIQNNLGVNELKKFSPGFGVISEVAKHTTGDRFAFGFLNAPHHHAKMGRLNDHSNPGGVHGLHNCLRNFASQSFLDLFKEEK